MNVVSLILIVASLLHSSLGLMPPLLTWRKLAKKNAASNDETTTISDECVQMKSAAGNYLYVSPGREDVCGLLIVGATNQVVAVEISEFDIDCEDDGLLVLIDGWEISGELFPSVDDHSVPVDQRYLGFCGEDRPRDLMIMTQNVAQLQFRIPRQGQHFKVRISYINNPQPCNAISTTSDGLATISNYGFERNCSLLFVYPELVQIVRMDVGQPSRVKSRLWSSRNTRNGRLLKCAVSGGDYVEILGGRGIDTSLMTRFLAVCGLHAKLGSTSDAVETVRIVYPYTAVRLVSTGRVFNSVTVRFQQLPVEAGSDEAA